MNETEQDRQDREAAELHQVMQEIQQEAEQALAAAAPHLTPDQLAALAWAARLPIPKEKRA